MAGDLLKDMGMPHAGKDYFSLTLQEKFEREDWLTKNAARIKQKQQEKMRDSFYWNTEDERGKDYATIIREKGALAQRAFNVVKELHDQEKIGVDTFSREYNPAINTKMDMNSWNSGGVPREKYSKEHEKAYQHSLRIVLFLNTLDYNIDRGFRDLNITANKIQYELFRKVVHNITPQSKYKNMIEDLSKDSELLRSRVVDALRCIYSWKTDLDFIEEKDAQLEEAGINPLEWNTMKSKYFDADSKWKERVSEPLFEKKMRARTKTRQTPIGKILKYMPVDFSGLIKKAAVNLYRSLKYKAYDEVMASKCQLNDLYNILIRWAATNNIKDINVLTREIRDIKKAVELMSSRINTIEGAVQNDLGNEYKSTMTHESSLLSDLRALLTKLMKSITATFSVEPIDLVTVAENKVISHKNTADKEINFQIYSLVKELNDKNDMGWIGPWTPGKQNVSSTLSPLVQKR